MPHQQEFKVYIITSRDILRFFAFDIILGTMTYAIAMKIFHNVILASAGGWVGTEGLKWLNAVRKSL